MAKIKLKSLKEFLDKWSFLINENHLSNLSIDYWNNPVRRGKLPNKQDLYYLFIELNLPLELLADYFKVSKMTITTWNKELGIQKTKQQVYELTKILNLRKFGVENPSQLPENKEKRRKTCLELYGVDNPSKLDINKKKVKQTCLERYGFDNPMKIQEFKDKLIKTNLKKFGVPCCTQNEEIKKKLKDKVPEMIEKSKKTCLRKYGVEYSLKDKRIREKGKNTCSKKYNKECYSGSDKYFENINKLSENCYITKKKNNSINSSSVEEKIFQLLKQKFKGQIVRQYRSNAYPFACDFYIKSLDLYIEYQGFWTHGKEPFDKENKEHQSILNRWILKSEEINFKDKHKELYKNAIETWTRRDPLKRRIAKENNLNWLEFFSMKEFENWYQLV